MEFLFIFSLLVTASFCMPQVNISYSTDTETDDIDIKFETITVVPKEPEPIPTVPSPVTSTEHSSESLNDVIDHNETLKECISDLIPTSHPCRRECIVGGPKMTCHYHFVVEWYHTMSQACYDCPFNTTDCYRPDCIAADGVKRPIIVVNRSLPGPSIEVCLGDEVVVDYENALMEESSSLHWHGMHQRASPYMDGVPFVTQCPILPKSTFQYKFEAATPGTHFWHSHSGCQRADGVFGALIVREPKTKDPHHSYYEEDLSEHVMIVMDWSHDLGVSVFTAHYHAGGDNKPKTLQINGRGIFEEFERNGTRTHTPPASFTVRKDKSYRFRLINSGVLNCPIALSIDNHTLIPIATDGASISPSVVDSIVSYAGERWDFVLRADQKIDNYWIRLRGLMDCDERFTSAHQAAVLRYEGTDCSAIPEGELSYELSRRPGLVLNELNAPKNHENSLIISEVGSKGIKSKGDPSLKETPDRKVIIGYDFHPIDNVHFHKPHMYGFTEVFDAKGRRWTPQLNHISLKLQPFPLMSQPEDIKPGMLCSNQDLRACNIDYCECTNVIDLKLGAVVELVLIDIGIAYDANHPFHLHGHSFYVVAMDRVGKNVSIEQIMALDVAGQIKRNLENPPLKDTVTVPDGGYTILRFHANNPGFWLFHCHIEFHVELGMALLFKVGEVSDFPKVPEGFPRCGNYKPTSKPEPEVSQSLTDKNSTLLNEVKEIINYLKLTKSSAPLKSGGVTLFFLLIITVLFSP